MKTTTQWDSRVPGHLFRPGSVVALLLTLLLAFIPTAGSAGSATWNSNPISGDWNTAANWTPAKVPNGPNDIATFQVSNIPAVTLSARESVKTYGVDQIVFAPEASAFTITANRFAHLMFSGAGIVNNSNVTQTFMTKVQEGEFGVGAVVFTNQASAGSLTSFINSASPSFTIVGGLIDFFDNAIAGNGTFTNEGGSVQFAWGGEIEFFDETSAGNATFINHGASNLGTLGGMINFEAESSAAEGTFFNYGADSPALGAEIFFLEASDAGNATITNNGGTVDGAGGGTIYFYDSTNCSTATVINNGGTAPGASGALLWITNSANAAGATLIANGGTNGGLGAHLVLVSTSEGGTARFQIFADGDLDISFHNSPGVDIGSLEGDGQVFLGARVLGVGTNNNDTVFSGVLQDGGEFGGMRGALSKLGTGTLSLTGANIYTGGTTVSAGVLKVNNRAGSGLGTGAVKIDAGTLEGRGTIAGTVTIGTGNGTGGFLAPSGGSHKPATLTIQSALTFRSDGTYTYKLNTKRVKADRVIADGVTIGSGAQFEISALADHRLTAGTVFTALSNTAATPIAGTFANLPDDSTLTVGNSTFQVDYQGGDGNDLTLTVAP